MYKGGDASDLSSMCGPMVMAGFSSSRFMVSKKVT
jgi:hypothetical protein